MTRASASLLSVLAAALWPAQGQAQAGPSFNCADSDTATEVTICANPELSQLELQMFASYLRLVDAVGERRARNIADRFLERRQACGSDEACIEERLRITLRVFERRAGGDTRLAAQEPSEDELTGRDAPEATAALEAAPPVVAAPPLRPERFAAFVEAEPALLSPVEAPAWEDLPLADTGEEPLAPEPVEEAFPDLEIASADPVSPDVPLAAQAPLPSDLDALVEDGTPVEEEPDLLAEEELPAAVDEPAPAAEAQPDAPAEDPTEVAAADPAAGEISGAIDGAELASATEPAPFDLPLSWAFMDLIRHQRSEIQTRLQAAGLYEGPADGNWDLATLSAMEAFFATEEGASFDPTTENGAALAFDFLRSDAYAEAHGLTPAEEVADPNDPLTSTEW